MGKETSATERFFECRIEDTRITFGITADTENEIIKKAAEIADNYMRRQDGLVGVRSFSRGASWCNIHVVENKTKKARDVKRGGFKFKLEAVFSMVENEHYVLI